VVWEESFDVDPLTDPPDNPVTITDANDDTWLEAIAVWNSGLLRHLSGGAGQNRGVAIVLNPANHPGMAAGDYTFTFDIVSMYSNCTMGVSIYDGTRDAGTNPANTYRLDLLSANGAPLVHETVGGTGDLTTLTNVTYVLADAGTGRTIEFPWDGTGDVVLVFDMPLSAEFQQQAELDNMSLGAFLPEPTNSAPAFAVDPILKSAAFADTLYSNSIAFTASDADGDTLVYSMANGPGWLSVDPDGTLHGIPSSSDLGDNSFTVRVDTPGGFDTAAMSVPVVPPAAACIRKPNILYILADDLGYLDISAHEYFDNPEKQDLEFRTPNIDTIFKGGIRFKAALMSNSVCAPSRAGILTGRSGSRFGFEANIPHDYASLPGSTIGLHTNEVTMADMLQSVGYKTYCVGKWHLGDNTDLFHPNVRGFDEFYGIIGGSRNYVKTTGLSADKVIMSNDVVVAEPADMYITDFFTDQALEYIEEQSVSQPDQPWFMYMSYTAPHGPMDAREADVARVPRVSHFGSEYTKDVPVKLLGTNGTVSAYTTRDNDELRQVYGAMVLSMDDNVGRLLNRLGTLGIADNTLVVFHSDNGGPQQGSNWSLNKPLRGTKGSLWEGGIRVPFAMQWPGVIPAGQVGGFDTPISSLDMMPTFAAVSGADQLREIRTDGINLMPLLQGRVTSLPPRQLYWRRGTGSKVAIRSGDYKYYENRTTGDEYLFDLENSASEWWEGLINSQPGIAAGLAAEYAEYEAGIPDPHWSGDGELLAVTTYDLDEAVTNQPYAMPLTHSPAGQSVTWSISAGKPDWLSINPATGELSGTPSPGDAKHNLITLQIDTGSATSTYRVPLPVIGGHDPDDTDADGLADAWELDQFGDLVTSGGGPADDFDSDGDIDLDEFINGTSATDPLSTFTVPFAVTGNTFAVSFSSLTNRSYVLHTTTNLAAGPWNYADSTENLQGNGTAVLRADLCEDPDTLFGRIKVKLDE
jgi:arylsulfatase A-like enzyme